MIAEKVYRLGLGLIVGILVARYLGPEQFGKLSYSLSIVGFLGTFVYMGLNALIVREIVRRKHQADQILGTTLYLKYAGCFIALLVALTIAFFGHDVRGTEFWILVIVGFSLLPRPLFQTLDFWFQSQVQSKYTVAATVTGLTIISVAKVILVLFGASVIHIAIAIASQFFIEAIVLLIIYTNKGFSVLQWTSTFHEAIDLLKNSWVLVLAVFLEQVYFRIDQVMLRWLDGASQVGVYAVAVKMSEVWYFIPVAIVASAFPKLLELKNRTPVIYEMRQQQVLDVCFVLGLTAAILVNFIAHPLVHLLYGDAYIESSSILVIHIWAGVFIFVGKLFHRWALIENCLYFLVFTGAMGAVINVAGNVVLIPMAQGRGAAIATLISYMFSGYLSLGVFKRTRPFAVKMSKAFALPVRFILYRKAIWGQP